MPKPKPTALVSLIGLATLSSACATMMYSGPPRGDNETAVVFAGKDTWIQSIDGRSTQDVSGSRYEVLTGRHELVVVAESRVGRNTLTSEGIAVCFSAKPAHVYEIHTSLKKTEIGDVVSKTTVVDVASEADVKSDCREKPNAQQSKTDTDGRKAPAPPSAASVSRHPEENVPGPKMSAREPPLGTGFQFRVGIASGGDRLVSMKGSNEDTSILTAGSGVYLSIGGTVNPLWIANTVGLGVGGSLGWKFDDLGFSSGDVVFTRYLLDLWLQSLSRVSDRWYLSAAAGMHKEYGASVSGPIPDQNSPHFESPWAWMGEVGPYFVSSWRTACAVTVRLTKVQYTNAVSSFDGTNISLGATFHFNL